ncbi:Xanthine/uracil/thiamine/ascorbate permease family protein [Anaerovibrio sp. JC8]|uniref:NCS2 family permease n=1 Tax=Anaerovibrio sp. JC8 TaxID=1240085 RepID=UPI000A0EA726|nr:NCS2 family permease [Anaerovibrio sp. JC8]ORU00619.1 Xanthine/uracil/thiamine/ascorbate permease family protein [Anaerovibrio sp. JC8]
MKEFIMQHFQIDQRQTSIKTELLCGLLNFFAIMYIIVVNPALFEHAGMSFGGVFLATICATAIGCFYMGMMANYPIVIAPGLGINAYVVYTVVVSMGYSWQDALGCCFVAATIFLVLSLTSFREQLINSIPECLKVGITAGIGLFVTFIGLKNGGLVVAGPDTFVTMGNMTDPGTALTAIGVLLCLIFSILNVPAAMLVSMIILTFIAWMLGMLHFPSELISLPADIGSTVGALEFDQIPEMIPIVMVILLVTMFDTTGTMIGVGKQAKIVKDGYFPNLRSALMADAFASFWGTLMGTGPCSSFAESSAGVMAGARTGLAAVTTGILFLSLIFIFPLAQAIASVPAITAPVLIIAGIQMFSEISSLDWEDKRTLYPSVLACIVMPLTYSITNGVAFGMISYVAVTVAAGKYREIHPLLYLFSLWFLLDFLHIL